MSLFSVLQVNGHTLNSFQKGIDLVNKNINNLNNRNYAKERAVFNELSGYGVTMAEAHRIYDQRYFDRFIHENQTYNFHEEYASSLESIEYVFNDLQGAGFSQELEDYFSAINDIVSEPDNLAARETFINNAKLLVSKFKESYKMLEDEKQNIQLAISNDVAKINDLTQSLTKINKAIAGEPTELIPNQEKRNTLLNERDKIIRELSSYIDVKVRYNQNGTADIFSAKGHALVLYDKSFTLSYTTATEDLGNGLTTYSGHLSIDGVDLTNEFAKGKLTAKLQTENFTKETIKKLNNFVINFAEKNNTIHNAGIDLNGASGQDLFVSNDTSSNINLNTIEFNNNIEARSIAAAKTDNNSDNTNVIDLYNLKNKTISTLDNKTFQDYYIGIVSNIANERNFHKYMAEDSKGMVDAIEKKLQEISGVNLDEELVNLTQLQRSYEAAARVLSVTDKLLEVVMGIVR